jgi:hypothetical protein
MRCILLKTDWACSESSGFIMPDDAIFPGAVELGFSIFMVSDGLEFPWPVGVLSLTESGSIFVLLWLWRLLLLSRDDDSLRRVVSSHNVNVGDWLWSLRVLLLLCLSLLELWYVLSRLLLLCLS